MLSTYTHSHKHTHTQSSHLPTHTHTQSMSHLICPHTHTWSSHLSTHSHLICPHMYVHTHTHTYTYTHNHMHCNICMHNQSYSLIDPLEVFAAKSLSLAKTDDKGLGQRPVGKVHIFTSLHSTHGETSVYDTALQGTEICSAQRETSPHLTHTHKKGERYRSALRWRRRDKSTQCF